MTIVRWLLFAPWPTLAILFSVVGTIALFFVWLFREEKPEQYHSALTGARIVRPGLLRLDNGTEHQFSARECAPDTPFAQLAPGQRVWIMRLEGDMRALYVTATGPKHPQRRHASLSPEPYEETF
jgi:hypothetical protein